MFIANNFEHISNLFLVFLLLTLSMYLRAGLFVILNGLNMLGGYLRYNRIISQRIQSETQVTNFFYAMEILNSVLRYFSFCISYCPVTF